MTPWFRFCKKHPPADADNPAVPDPGKRRGFLIDLVHLFALSGFALAQPIFVRLAERSAYLIDKQISLSTLMMFVLALSFGIPALLTAGEAVIARLVPRARDSFYTVTLFGLMVLFLLPILKRTGLLPGGAVVAGSLLISTVAVWAYYRFQAVRSTVTVAAWGALTFPIIFVGYSPVSALIFPKSYTEAPARNPVPVVMLVFDELCGGSLLDDHNAIDADRFPHFAELSRRTTWFRNATTVHQDTEQAVPAILSGKYQRLAGVPSTWHLPQNLFSILRSEAGYEMAAFEPVTSLSHSQPTAWYDNSAGIFQQLGSLSSTLGIAYLLHVAPLEIHPRLPKPPLLWFGMRDSEGVDRTRQRGVFRYRWGDERNNQFNHFLDCISNLEEPALFFQHILIPHVPWSYLPSGKNYSPDNGEWSLMNFNTAGLRNELWGGDDLFVIQNQQRYLLQAQYADRLVGRLLERLDATGLFDRCLLIVIADHGVSFHPGQSRRAATPETLADILSIPLFIKTPHQATGGVSEREVESVDVFPTIAQVLGIDLKLPVDGWSVLDETHPDRLQKTLDAESERLHVDPTVVKRFPASAELHRRFGSARDPEALYRIGPHAELVGRSVADLKILDERPCEIKLSPASFRLTSDAKQVVPCYVEGRIQTPAVGDQPVLIAMAVNGVIRTTTRTYLLNGMRDQFNAMLPETAFEEGDNRVECFAIVGDPSKPALVPCQIIPMLPDIPRR